MLKARRKADRILCSGASRTCRGILSERIIAGFPMLYFGWHRQPHDIDGLPVYCLSKHAQKRYKAGLSPRDRRVRYDERGTDPADEVDTPPVPCILICPRCGKPNLIDPDELDIKRHY